MNTLSGNGLTIGQSLTPNYQMKIQPKQDIAREFFYNEDPGGVVTPRYFTHPKFRPYFRTPAIKENELFHFNNFIESMGGGLDKVQKRTPLSIAKGFVKRVGEPVGVRDYVEAMGIIDETETNPLKKRLRMIRLNKSNPLDPGLGGV